MIACHGATCRHPRSQMPAMLSRIAERIQTFAFDYLDRTPRERLALERARRENPGRAAELRRMESVQRGMRLLDRRRG